MYTQLLENKGFYVQIWNDSIPTG